MAHSTPIALTGSNQLVLTGTGVFRGFTLRETAGASAVVRFYDSTAASGLLIDSVSLSANESTSDMHDGILLRTGLYANIVSGTVEGSVRL